MFDGENQYARKAVTTANQLVIIDLSRQVNVPLELIDIHDEKREGLVEAE